MRGLKAPPRSIRAPAALTTRAAASICVSLSIEQGPAMITGVQPSPKRTPATSTMVLSGWKSRETSLYGLLTWITSRTPGSSRMEVSST